MRLTLKQFQLLGVVLARNADGTDVDLDQLLQRLEYQTTKQSLQFSVRALMKHRLIEKSGFEKRRGRRHVLIRATQLGVTLLQPGERHINLPVMDYVVEEFDDNELGEDFLEYEL